MEFPGYAIDWARNGPEAESLLDHEGYDLLLVDPGLLETVGMGLHRRVRSCSMPVLVLTARDARESRISGLEKVDYLVESFGIDELAAQVRASLRRYARQIGLVYSHGDLSLRPATREATLKGEPLVLAPQEFDLLQALIEEPKRVLTRSEVSERLDGPSEACGSDKVETYVHDLQSKIGAAQIVTVRGVGYRLR
ncbi:response regulator transcription factor [Paraburkholderia terrae]|uniref:response regulator transcription factor n=1 Tax=Paraburkholderia terrae TaxID=311230 RepID=UPI00336563A6